MDLCWSTIRRSRWLVQPLKTLMPRCPKALLVALKRPDNYSTAPHSEGARDHIGLGEAVGRALLARNPKHRDYSLLCAAYESKIPFTAHVTIGGDIAHFHPSFDGAALGATTHTDFRLLAELVRQNGRRRSLPQHRIGSGAARSLFEMRDAGTQPWPPVDRHHDCKLRLHSILSAADQCGSPPN